MEGRWEWRWSLFYSVLQEVNDASIWIIFGYLSGDCNSSQLTSDMMQLAYLWLLHWTYCWLPRFPHANNTPQEYYVPKSRWPNGIFRISQWHIEESWLINLCNWLDFRWFSAGELQPTLKLEVQSFGDFVVLERAVCPEKKKRFLRFLKQYSFLRVTAMQCKEVWLMHELECVISLP